MRIMAIGTKIICPLALTCKVSHPFSVDAGLPVLVDISMTFSTEPVALRKVDQIPVKEPELVSILRIVAIKTPSHRFGMMKPNIGMFFFQFSFFSVHLH
jgi:hypothetical protein